MKVAVIGAHGRIARLVTRILADRATSVRGIVRSEAQLPLVTEMGGTPALLDVEHASTQQIADELSGHDAVVWCAGAGGGNPDRTYAVDRDAAIRAMDAALDVGIERFVMVSWIGSVPDHGIDPASSFFPYADAKLAADDHLRGTSLAWTILGPGTLTDEDPQGTITVVPPDAQIPRGAPSAVSRADVALVVAETVRLPETAGRFIRFTAGDTPITEALRAPISG